MAQPRQRKARLNKVKAYLRKLRWCYDEVNRLQDRVLELEGKKDPRKRINPR